jgi:Winged helix-turn helix
MPTAVGLRPDWDAKRVRVAAREAEDATQHSGRLAIAASYQGQDRAACAKIGAMDSQRLRDWVHRFDAAGPEGLIDRKPARATRRLISEQEAKLAALIEAGSEFERDGVVRWRCIGTHAPATGRGTHEAADARRPAHHSTHLFGALYPVAPRLGTAFSSTRPRHLNRSSPVGDYHSRLRAVPIIVSAIATHLMRTISALS